MLEVVLQDPQVQREYLLGCFLKNLAEFGDLPPSDIAYFAMLGNRFSIFHLAQEDKAHPSIVSTP